MVTLPALIRSFKLFSIGSSSALTVFALVFAVEPDPIAVVGFLLPGAAVAVAVILVACPFFSSGLVVVVGTAVYGRGLSAKGLSLTDVGVFPPAPPIFLGSTTAVTMPPTLIRSAKA